MSVVVWVERLRTHGTFLVSGKRKMRYGIESTCMVAKKM